MVRGRRQSEDDDDYDADEVDDEGEDCVCRHAVAERTPCERHRWRCDKFPATTGRDASQSTATRTTTGRVALYDAVVEGAEHEKEEEAVDGGGGGEQGQRSEKGLVGEARLADDRDRVNEMSATAVDVVLMVVVDEVSRIGVDAE